MRGKTGKLCKESYFGISTLVAVFIALLIGQSDSKSNSWLHSHRVNTSTSERWTDEVQSDQCLWLNTSPNFGGTRSGFPGKVLRYTLAWLVSRRISVVYWSLHSGPGEDLLLSWPQVLKPSSYSVLVYCVNNFKLAVTSTHILQAVLLKFERKLTSSREHAHKHKRCTDMHAKTTARSRWGHLKSYTPYSIVHDLPSISNQWPVITQRKTSMTDKQNDIISADVNRPQHPKEILQQWKNRHKM